MDTSFRIVHVEDSPDDAELVALALRDTPYATAMPRVETESDYVAQLDAGVPDVIICDYQMPRFTAERALEILAERKLDVPFIVVSHHIGESAAVIAMQRGAADYLSKRDLGRLPKAIASAIERRDARRGCSELQRGLTLGVSSPGERAACDRLELVMSEPCPARLSALAIIRGEHAAFDGALSWIRGHLALARAHRIAPDPGTFQRGLAFIATFMENFHHPKEDEFLFKAVRERTREADEVLANLQQQHAEMPEQFRNLRLALSGARQGATSQLDDFADLFGRFADAQVEHMGLESGVFAMAERVLKPADWGVIDAAFRANRDPLFGAGGGGLSSIMTRR